jgi:MFS family permease
MESAMKYPSFRWFVMAAITVAYMGLGMVLIGFAPIVGMVAKEFHITVGQMSFYSMGIAVLTGALATIASGPLIDRFGLKPTLLVGIAITVIGALLVPVVTYSVAGLILLRIFGAIGTGPIGGCISAVAARWFPYKQRGIFAGAVGGGISLGIAIGFIMMGAGLKAYNGDWRAAMLTLAIGPIVGLIMIVIMAIFGKEPRVHDVEVHRPGEKDRDFTLALRSPTIYVTIVCMFCLTWMMNAFNDLTPGYIAIPKPMGLGLGPAAAGTHMSAVQIGMILGAVFAGFIIDKVFKGNTKPVIFVGFVVAGLTMLSVGYTFVHDSARLFVACLFLAGFFEAFVIPCLTAFIAGNYPYTIVGKVFSLVMGIGIFGGSIGVSVGSGVLHFTSSYRLPIVIVAIVALVGVIATVFLNSAKAISEQEVARSA